MLFKRFGTVKNDPASIPNSLRMLGLMGIHALLWMWFVLLVLLDHVDALKNCCLVLIFTIFFVSKGLRLLYYIIHL